MPEGIQFNDENEFKSREVFGAPRKPGMVAWMERKGVVKDEKTAHFILILIIILSFGLAGVVVANNFFGGANVKPVSPEERIEFLERIESIKNSDLPNDVKETRIKIINQRLQ